ncbi:MAG: class I SAM-dependent methyltransferase [Terracidiphilus sp.]
MQAGPGRDGWYTDEELTPAVCEWEFPHLAAERAREQAAALLRLAGVCTGAAILDVGCGPGHYLLACAQLGYACTGLDRSAKMLERAQRATQAHGARVELVRGDARNLTGLRRFDLALSIGTSFGYFPDDQENDSMLAGILRVLKPGGHLLLDLDGKEVVARGFRPRHWSERDGVLVVEERRPVRAWRWLEIRRRFIAGEDRQECVIGYRLYSADEICAALQRQGYCAIRCFGDFEGAPYDHLAKRLIVIARNRR